MPRHGRGERTTSGRLVFLGTLRRGLTPPELPGALCAQRNHDPDLWFPKNGDWASAERAKTICQLCPVQDACLEWALEAREREGIWGGTTPDDRRRLQRTRARGRVARGAAA